MTAPAAVRRLGLLLAAQVAWLAVATALSERPDLSVAGTNWRRFGLVTQSALAACAFLVAAVISARPALGAWMLRMLAGAAALAALYGIAQYFGLDPWIDPKAYRVGEGEWMIVRPPSTLGHANYAGVIYLAGGFAGAAVGGAAGRASAVACAVAVLLGGSRAAMLGLVAGGLVLAWPPNRRRFAWLAAALAAVALFYFTPPGQRFRARVRWFLEDPRGGARLMLWQGTLALAAERPLAGWGPETYTEVFARRQPAELSAAYPDFYHESPHNIFLDALAAQGIPGLLLLAAICAVGVTAARGSPLLAPLVAMLVALQFNTFILPTALSLYVVVALAVARASACRAGTRAGAWPVLTRFIPVPLAILWLTFTASLALWDRQLKRVDSAIAAGNVEQASRHWTAAQRVKPWGAAADLWYSRRLLPLATGSAAAFHQALAAGREATRTAEDPQNAWFHLSTLHALVGDAANTERCLRNAIEAAPTWPKPRLTLSRLLRLTGQVEEAEREAARGAFKK
jgi:hypothetical protein